MRSLLFVTASLMGENSKSRQVAGDYIAAAKAASPGLAIRERHLTPDTIPHLSMDTLAALGTAADQRSDAQRTAATFADTVIEEVEAADVVVIATPMYNFSIPSTLKAWLDHLARAGRTFRYTAAGPEGLLAGKRVIVVASRGGVYTGESPARALDFQEPYLRAFFGFLGITDVTFVHVEGQAIGAEAAAKSVERARDTAAHLIQQAA